MCIVEHQRVERIVEDAETAAEVDRDVRRPGADGRALKPLTLVLGLLALQGAVGGLQWALELPAGIVWVHVAIATGNWLAMLWTVAAAGRLEPGGRAGGRRRRHFACQQG